MVDGADNLITELSRSPSSSHYITGMSGGLSSVLCWVSHRNRRQAEVKKNSQPKMPATITVLLSNKYDGNREVVMGLLGCDPPPTVLEAVQVNLSSNCLTWEGCQLIKFTWALRP